MSMSEDKRLSCGACGSPAVVREIYFNKEKEIYTPLCALCARTAQLNGYVELKERRKDEVQ